MKQAIIIILLALVALGDSGCSCLSARGRREAAYARYVRRASAGRVKMQRKFASLRKTPETEPLSQPQISTSVGPESVTAANEAQ
jgi:hypothetical protein